MAAGIVGSWMTDGTVPKDQGFDDWMTQIATARFKAAADEWIAGTGGNVKPEWKNPDGTVDYSKVDMGGDMNTLQKFVQEIGEGDQGKTLYGFYKKGLTTDQVQAGYAKQDSVASAIRVLNGGGAVTPDMQKLIDSGDLVKQTSTAQGGGEGGGADTTTTIWTAGAGPTGMVSQPLFSHQGQTGMDESKIGFDPKRGFMTQASNVHTSEGAGADKAWEIAGQMAPMAIMGAGALFGGPTLIGMLGDSLGAGLGIGSFGGTLLSAGGDLALNGKINPVSLATSAAGASGLTGQIADALGVPSAVVSTALNVGGGALNKDGSLNINVGAGDNTPKTDGSPPAATPPKTPAAPKVTVPVTTLSQADADSMSAGVGVTHGANSALGNGMSALPGQGGSSALPGKGIVDSATGG